MKTKRGKNVKLERKSRKVKKRSSAKENKGRGKEEGRIKERN